MKIYEVEEPDKQNGFPRLNNINDVKKIISIHSIDVLEEEKDNFGYLGFECGCPWDVEHGLRITVHKDRVVSIDTDSSYYSYEEILKDKFTEEEWKSYIESREKQKEESLAKYYEEKALLEKENQEKEENINDFYTEKEKSIKVEKNTVSNKKWWQFWK